MTFCVNSGSGTSSFLKQRIATLNVVLLMSPSCLYMTAMDHTLLTKCCISPKRTTLSSFDYPLIPPIACNHLMSVSLALFSDTGWRGVMISWSPLGKRSTLWILSENTWKSISWHSLKIRSRQLGKSVESVQSIAMSSQKKTSQLATAHQLRVMP